MYHYVNDFLSDWGYESESTLKLFKNLTDESLSKKVHEDVRSLGFLAWHLIHTMEEMMKRTGIIVDIKEQQNYSGESAKELCDWYEKGARSLAEQIKNNWTDADLQKEDEMYGDKWKRGTTLQILVKHQAHHRAEMVVIMRILGLPIIGAYGPTREDWKVYGMETML
jgi:uncharacterized damage-inducible protein DinB